ncbi:MAG TPA: hypothetical protein VMV49_15295 [Candidatus Deferrimicrobium sp.]|nr:hypothetical protein [Candidatus Deferrimicrobium sp.]
MEIEWAKIIEKPEAKYKVDGNILLKYRMTTENLNKDLDLLRKKAKDTENQNNKQKITIQELQDQVQQFKTAAEDLQNELNSVINQKDSEISDLSSKFQTDLEQKNAEITKIMSELDNVKNSLTESQTKLSDTENQLNEKTSKLSELQEANAELSTKNQELTSHLEKIEPIINEANELKTKIEEIQKELVEKNLDISQLNEKIEALEKEKVEIKANHESEIETLKQHHLDEINAKIDEYEQKIQEIKDSYGLTAREAQLTGTEQVIILRYTGTDFLYVRNKPDEGIVLILDRQENKWLLAWEKESGFIDRRTAERLARSIAKSGWPLPGGGRVGMGFDLEMQGDKAVPERLLRDQHKYME